MGLFSKSQNLQMEQINAIAKKSQQVVEVSKKVNARGIKNEISRISEKVLEHFKDSHAELITSAEQLHDYVSNMIAVGIGSIDTETTGLDRLKDTIVGASLYYPGGVEVYIPIKHIVPIFDTLYRDQLTYEQVAAEFQRLVDNGVKLVFANADFDLAMIYKDLHVDLLPVCFYDVILAWRCLKENEQDNSLKGLYTKYVLKGAIDRMKFSDFFTADLFPYCDPQIAKLYAAADAKYTYDLFLWQLPYLQKDNPKCKKHHFEAISDLYWGVEVPMIGVCQNMHRTGVYLEQTVATKLRKKYGDIYKEEQQKARNIVHTLLESTEYSTSVKRPFADSEEFNPNSNPHVEWLVYDYMKLISSKNRKTNKETLDQVSHVPIVKQVLKCRSLATLIGTFVEKLPKLAAESADSRIHCRFNSIGADTGRMSSADPNMQNIPSHAGDIRHMFRASPGYVMMSSDYSQQEPKLTAYVSGEPKMINTFKEGRDIYATMAAIAYHMKYEDCLEFHPETHEYQPDGKQRRGVAKVLVLGINYGMDNKTIGQKVYGDDPTITDDEKAEKAAEIFDALMQGFPDLNKAILSAQRKAARLGYTETILGRRRHHPDMQLPMYQFKPGKGYVNPDFDPLNPATFENSTDIPERIKEALLKELTSYKYFGQVWRRMKELSEKENIQVINNRQKIEDAKRKVWNAIIQGSAAELTKLAMLKLVNDPEWNEIGGRLILPVHDELMGEVPLEHRERGAAILKRCMESAGDFLPFPISCDIEETFRWYGIAVDDLLSYERPADMNFGKMSESNIKWVQSRLYECGYELPILKGPDGKKPIGVAAKGVNGVVTDELTSFCSDYRSKHFLATDQDFFDHIDKLVTQGVV